GNVYRAELLYRHGVHPHRPGTALGRPTWDAMWPDLVTLMRYGLRRGRIDTVRPEHTPKAMGRPARQDRPGGEADADRPARRDGRHCLGSAPEGGPEVLEGRTLFWCPPCQPD